jgi:tetratricopeptide (TPR) repeat protein
MSTQACPTCGEPAAFSKKRGQFYCADCEVPFDGEVVPGGTVTPTGSDFGRADRSFKLFLSYGHDDLVQEVRTLRDALRARGHEVWFDEEQLQSGLPWEDRIEQGLDWCDRVVLTMTPHSVRRPDGYCLNELAKALELRRTIIPVLLLDVPQGAPTSICRIQYLDWRDTVPAAEKAERFAQRLLRLCEAIEQDKLDFEGGQQRLVRYLQPINHDGDIQRHVASFQGRVQLEARLRAWLDDPLSAQVLWLRAAPGLGKSAVAASLAHRWAEIGAAHFCVAGHQDKTDPARAVLSIAYQLSTKLDERYRARLSQLELERESQKDARTLFDTLLVGPLARDFPAPARPWVVILDGLDEATGPDGQNVLAEIVAADWRRLPDWLRLLVSSRPEAEIAPWLSGTAQIELRGDDLEQQSDLATYARARLAAIGRAPSEAALARILERSQGAFHYVVLLLEEVRLNRCDPEDPVDLPAGMHSFYLQIFRWRFKDVALYRAGIGVLLGLMLAGPEPVPLAILAAVTGRPVGQVRAELVTLGSLLSIEQADRETDDKDWDTVRPAHASLRTWLTGLDATRQPLAGPYAAEEDHARLAGAVLARWEAGRPAGNESGSADRPEPEGFVARTLWPLLKAVKDEASMGMVGFHLSVYWKSRQLALAIEPAEHAAEARWRAFEAGAAEPAVLEQAGLALVHLGELQGALGRSALALASHRRSLAIRERLVSHDPDNAGWQRDLGISHNRTGDVLRAQGNLSGALKEYQEALSIVARLAVHDADNAGWQRDLGVSHNQIGGVLRAQGNPSGALEAYQRALAIAERLAAQDPDNVGCQRDVAMTHNRIGGVLEGWGLLVGALEEFRKGLVIFQRLAARDPASTNWQRELGVCRHCIGSVLQAQGKLVRALEEFHEALAIRTSLVAQDPDNAGWQRDLAASYNRIGGVLEAQGNLAGALEVFRKALAIRERLTAQDPDNVGWQRELGVSYKRIGAVLEAQGDPAAALAMSERSFRLREKQAEKLSPDRPSSWDCVLEGMGRSGAPKDC